MDKARLRALTQFTFNPILPLSISVEMDKARLRALTHFSRRITHRITSVEMDKARLRALTHAIVAWRARICRRRNG